MLHVTPIAHPEQMNTWYVQMSSSLLAQVFENVRRWTVAQSRLENMYSSLCACASHAAHIQAHRCYPRIESYIARATTVNWSEPTSIFTTHNSIKTFLTTWYLVCFLLFFGSSLLLSSVTLLGSQSRFGGKLLGIGVVCPPRGLQF